MRHKTFTAAPGLSFSVIGFGCWALSSRSGWHGADDRDSIATVHAALECGITFFDTAPVYGLGGSEELLGQALKGRRDAVTLASKCGLLWDAAGVIRRDLSFTAITTDVEASLRRLNTDRLDLLQLHWPDAATPLEETARALDGLLRAGKVRHVGVSNFSAADTEALGRMVPLATYQGLYNLLERNPESYHGIVLDYRMEQEIVPLCERLGIGLLPYSPLFQGLLTGKLGPDSRFGPDDVRSANPKLAGSEFRRLIAVVEELKPIAADAGLGLAELSLAWLACQPVVASVISGAHRPEQVVANAAAADVVLSEETERRIAEVLSRNEL